MRKLFKERKLFKGGNYVRKYDISIDNSQPDTLLIPKLKLQLLVLWLHTEGTTSYAVGSLGVVNNFELAIFLACC